MRIALDASHALDRNPSGVAVYCENLIRELLALNPGQQFLLAYRANRYARSWRRGLPGPNASRALLEEPFIRLWAGRVSLFHGLNQRLPATRFRRTAVTFHDLFVLTGDYSTSEFRKRFAALARDAARRADRLIAVSAFTADQTAKLLGEPRERIAVVHHGVTPPPEFPAGELDRFRRRHKLDRPFVLHVGAIQGRKNIARLVEAFETLPGEPLLVLAGAGGYGSERILRRIEASPARARIRLPGYVSAADRAKLYRTAAAFAFPSLDEGFGLPALEALAVGLPAVVSNRSALPEVVGDAALLVDPFDGEAIREGLIRALDDEDVRAHLAAAGPARASRFTWRNAAGKTWAVYRELLG